MQESHHYEDKWYTHQKLESIQQRDNIKKQALESRGDTLITIPYWWDGSSSSLIATIQEHRPDIFPDPSNGAPISYQPHSSAENGGVPDVGQLMLAAFPEENLDIINWWIGEKYDGLRACWNKQQLYTRAGKAISLNKIFLDHFPADVRLDGEIWLGRGSYANISKLYSEACSFWEYGRFNVFDSPSPSPSPSPSSLPHLPLYSEEYEKRFSALMSNVPPSHPFINLSPCHTNCSKEWSKFFTSFIIEGGGEGMIARKPESLYVNGRSDVLMKFKVSRDSDGILVGINDQESSCTIKLENGSTIKAQLPTNLKSCVTVGDVVSFTYVSKSSSQEVSFARVYRKRDPIIDLPINKLNEATTRTFKNRKSQFNPKGYWTDDGNSNMRKVLDEFARQSNFDPTNPENWYKITKVDILKIKGGHSIVNHYGSSFINALLDLYPNIGLKLNKFPTVKHSFWHNHENRRALFTEIANQLGFDPLVPINWYNVDRSVVLKACKGSDYIVRSFFGSLSKALEDAYPEIGLDSSMFPKKKYWVVKENRRKAMDKLALDLKFDPSKADNWFRVPTKDMAAQSQDLRSILRYYGSSLLRALVDIYPDMALSHTKKIRAKFM